jgi:hypothetical protein
MPVGFEQRCQGVPDRVIVIDDRDELLLLHRP